MSRKNCRISVFTQKFGFWSERSMDIWNNMPPFLVFSYAKSIAIKFWQLQNKIEEKILIWKALFVIPSIPTRNYLFKVSNWSKRITCENCLRLGKKPLEQCQWRRSRVCIVNCESISNFRLIIDFEQAKVCWVHIEKVNTFEGKIRNIIR